MDNVDNKEQLIYLAQRIIGGNETTQHSNDMGNEVYEAILLEYKSSGASGGNCYGDRATTYYHDTDEKIYSIDNNVIEYMHTDLDFNEAKYKDLVYDAVSNGSSVYSYTEGGDYYGNYSEYETTTISLEDFITCFNNEEDGKLFLEAFEEVAEVKIRENRFENLNLNIARLNKEKLTIQKSIDNHQEEMKKIQEEQLKEKKQLENKLAQIDRYLENMDVNSNKVYKQKEKEIQRVENQTKTTQENIDYLANEFPELVKSKMKKKY